MFAIEFPPENGPAKYVIDYERDASVHRVCGLVQQLGDVFVLKHRNQAVPFETYIEIATDSQGRRSMTRRFIRFGGSALAEREAGLGPFEFEDAMQEHNLKNLAIEAVLAYDQLPSTTMDIDERIRFELPGKKLTLASGQTIEVPPQAITLEGFGYASKD